MERSIINKIMDRTIHKRSREKSLFESERICNGDEHKDKVFYVIYRKEQWEGLMSYVNSFLWYIVYAKKHGYIPIIDMMNWQNAYMEDGELGERNSYEKYFLQPEAYNANAIKDAYNVITNKGLPSFCKYTKRNSHIVKKKWRKAYQENIKINPEVLQEINQAYSRIIQPTDVVIGINIRGTDYTKLQCSGLPRQPEVSEITKKAKEWFEKYHGTKYFVCCDALETLEYVEAELGKEYVVTNARTYYPVDLPGEVISNPMFKFERSHDEYYKGLEYLTSIVILSRCDYLVGGCSGATVSAQLMRSCECDFKKKYIWNLGQYK